MISGLSGCGKSRLAAQLAPLLALPVIDKDDILERLRSKGHRLCVLAAKAEPGKRPAFSRGG